MADRAAPAFEDAQIALGDRVQTVRRPVVPPDADFSEAAIIAAARKQTGLHFFGDDPFRTNLRVLIRSIEDEAKLNPFGRVMARQFLIARLADRLRAQDLFDRHPEILETKLGPMTFIVGSARSGTTRAHRLLARDPRFLYLRDWEINFPVPMPASFGDGPDPRIGRAKGAHAAFLAMNPENAHIHTLDAEAPEEEIGLLSMSFSSLMIEVQRFVPTYGRYCLRTNQHAAYAYMKKLIQLVAWFRKDDPDRPWVFKSPQHMQDIDALMQVFPDAKIVFMHRDPRKTVASTCSMFWNISILGSDDNDPHALGHYIAEKVHSQIAKVEQERRTIVPADQQLDMRYADINADWAQQMQRIYDFIGIPFTPEARAALNAASEDRDARHGGHKYRLEDFGLSAEGIDALFADYVEKYGIPAEDK
ncbi:sulfotransferase [Sphingobium sp. HBC34]|uniref:Sulfotransferase n=1 Tax=Sphingobium cyanobacteriorum TaxID=3063954 RepID=A0ABT8ZM57_9SPHN|nr:sulfotransferase [Sphingobium sp. HBC34]MDO7835610.1 sulfotransferase [Sphingobium sp. HBC34]